MNVISLGRDSSGHESYLPATLPDRPPDRRVGTDAAVSTGASPDGLNARRAVEPSIGFTTLKINPVHILEWGEVNTLAARLEVLTGEGFASTYWSSFNPSFERVPLWS